MLAITVETFLLCMMAIGYLIGSTPIGCIVAWRKFGIDLLNHGSKNMGATNVERVLLKKGVKPKVVKKWRYVVEGLDQLKGLLPMLAAIWLLNFSTLSMMFLAIGLILGHCYSFRLGFKGGKGVATTMGIITSFSPIVAVPCYIFWYMNKIAFAKHTEEATGLASIRAACLMGVAGVSLFNQDVKLFGYLIGYHDVYLQSLFALSAFHIVFAHRENLKNYKAEMRKKKLFPRDMPVGVFMTDSATNDPVKIRALLEQKFALARKIPLWFFTSPLFHLVPFMFLKMGEVIVTGADGKQTRQYTWGFPWTPAQMKANPKKALRQLIKLARYLERRGANRICLGATTAVIGDKGKTIAASVNIPVVSGNGTTGGLGAECALETAQRMGRGEPSEITGSVYGPGGSVGSAVCHILLSQGIGKLLLVGHELGSVASLASELNGVYGAGKVEEVTSEEAQRKSELLVFATSSDELIPIDPELLQDGVVLSDLARPRNVSGDLARLARLCPNDGVLVEIDSVEGKAGLGLPPNTYFPCWTELALASLEGWTEDRVGHPTCQEIEESLAAFKKHGFKIACLRLQEKPFTWEEVDDRRKQADMIRQRRQGK